MKEYIPGPKTFLELPELQFPKKGDISDIEDVGGLVEECRKDIEEKM